MNWMIEFYPVIAMALLWSGAGIAGVIIAILLWQRRRGSLIRSLALILVLLALANPKLKQEEREPLSNVLLVVVDESASQKIAGRTEKTKAIREALSAQLSKFPNLDVRYITSTNKSENAKEGTTLFSDLNSGLTGVPADRLAGVILVTDGQVHDVPAAPRELGFDAPVHALITGVKGERDRRIKIIKAPRFGIVGGQGTIELKVIESGAGSELGQLVKLKVTLEDQPVKELNVKVGATIEVPISFPHAGENIVELEVEEAENELTMANNRTAISAEGVRENLRVLLVSGEPHAGERTWRNLLKSDAAVDLVHFTILRPPEKQDGTPINQLSLIAFPTRELFSEKLEEFDLIIFDRYQRRGVLPILYLDNVSRYVEKGGAVLVAAGESYSAPTSLFRTPLSHILPASPSGRIIEEPYRAQIAEPGRKHPVTKGLPGGQGEKPQWGRWFRLIEAVKSSGQTLMTGSGERPLLILDRKGEGRVALLLSDHAWLWARGYDGGGPYSDLLRRLAHWLMKEPDLEEEFLRAKGGGRHLSIERRSMKEKIGPVTVVTPSGEEKTVDLEKSQLGLWRKTLEAEEPGLYRLKSGKLSAIAHVGPLNSRELAHVEATDGLLEPVLQATGGGSFWMGQKDNATAIRDLPRINMLSSSRVMSGSDWMGLRDQKAYIVKGVKFIPLFTGLLALSFMLSLIGLTWFREGH